LRAERDQLLAAFRGPGGTSTAIARRGRGEVNDGASTSSSAASSAAAASAETAQNHDGPGRCGLYDQEQWPKRPRGSCMSCGSVGTSILSTPSTGSPSRHWTAGFGAARRGARDSTRSPKQARVPIPEIERT
jgi:hypothetical protein